MAHQQQASLRGVKPAQDSLRAHAASPARRLSRQWRAQCRWTPPSLALSTSTHPTSSHMRGESVVVAAAAAATATALVARPQLELADASPPSQGSAASGNTSAAAAASGSWLESCIPELVKQLSPPAVGATTGADTAPPHLPACVQRVLRAPDGRIVVQHVQLAPQDLTSPEAWSRLSATCQSSHAGNGAQPIALILARPIPDPEHYCPLSSGAASGWSSSSSSEQRPSSSAAPHPQPPAQCCGSDDCRAQAAPAVAGSAGASCGAGLATVEPDFAGQVDVDNCCGGGSMGAGVAHDSQTAALRARAAQLVGSSSGISGSSSSGSSGSEGEDVRAGSVGMPTQHQPRQQRSRRRFLRRQAMRQAAAAATTALAAIPPRHEANTGAPPNQHQVSQQQQQQQVGDFRYYGVAVQCLERGVGGGAGSGPTPLQRGAVTPRGDVEGCYVLKLSRNRDATGCTCTLYTLTHVCHGQPLHTQLQRSWLAPSAPVAQQQRPEWQ